MGSQPRGVMALAALTASSFTALIEAMAVGNSCFAACCSRSSFGMHRFTRERRHDQHIVAGYKALEIL